MPAKVCEILPLLKQQVFAALAFNRGHVALCEKVFRRRDETFGKLHALPLKLDLTAQIGDRRLHAGEHRVQALALGRGALLFGRNLMAERFLLLVEGGQLCAVDVLAIRRDLGGRDGEKRIALVYRLAFLDVEAADNALRIREDFERAGRRS